MGSLPKATEHSLESEKHTNQVLMRRIDSQEFLKNRRLHYNPDGCPNSCCQGARASNGAQSQATRTDWEPAVAAGGDREPVSSESNPTERIPGSGAGLDWLLLLPGELPRSSLEFSDRLCPSVSFCGTDLVINKTNVSPRPPQGHRRFPWCLPPCRKEFQSLVNSSLL